MKRKSNYIQDLIAQGEHEHQDFKYQITDARKIARSVAAFANNSGGHLLIGVKDNGNIVGVSSDEEIYMIDTAAQRYCRPQQQVTYKVYRVNGKAVVKADIAEAADKPVTAPDENGVWRVYYRVADENVLASHVHERILRQDAQQQHAGDTIACGEHEQMLLDYLHDHGGITIEGFMRLAHISRQTAELTVVTLHGMGVVGIAYHGGDCLVTARHGSTS